MWVFFVELRLSENFFKRARIWFLYFKMKKASFLLFILLFFSSCLGSSFLCWNEEKTLAIAFNYDYVTGQVILKDRQYYTLFGSEKEPLSLDKSGGSYRLTMEKDQIVLEFIQYLVLWRMKLPSGKFAAPGYQFSRYDIDNHKKIRSYHANYPFLYRYVFDINSLELVLSVSPLSKPRSARENKYTFDIKNRLLTPQKTKNLTDEEAFSVLQPEKKAYTINFVHCENETFSLKRVIRTIYRTLSFH